MNPRILVVEDLESTGQLLTWYFRNPPDWPATRKVPRFDTDWVKSAREARALLDEAARRGQPYDAMLLDLQLPEFPGDEFPHQTKGLNVLGYRTDNSCAAVVIASIHFDPENVRLAFQRQADDYVKKDIRNLEKQMEDIYKTVVAAYRKGLEKRWGGLRRERVETRLNLACARVADHMARVVSDGTYDVLGKADELAGLIRDRWGFNSAKAGAATATTPSAPPSAI